MIGNYPSGEKKGDHLLTKINSPSAFSLKKTTRYPAAFTLIEIAIVIVIIVVLAAIVIPKYIDLRKRANKANVSGSVGALRGAVYLQYSAISSHEVRDAGIFPTVLEMQNNLMNRTGYSTAVMEEKMPDNVFDEDESPDNIADATGAAKGALIGGGGWAYNPNTGEIWANTNVDGENYL
jgi:prepilin-type N-terminal cleavage/methylation domain-containing protein